MRKAIHERAMDVCGGVLESRIVARMSTNGRDYLTYDETMAECKYILETIDYAGYDSKETATIKRACRYILKCKA